MADMADTVLDPRDRALFCATPMLMAPRFGVLPELCVGEHRFVAAANGIFVQARSKALAVTLKVARAPRLPYGELRESVELAGGRIPVSLWEAMRTKAVARAPKEWAGVVVYEGDAYRLIEPEVESVSGAHIRYRTEEYDDEAVALDVHSHGHGNAFFSDTDDESDRGGFYIACVLGNCRSVTGVSVKTRIALRGIFYNVEWTPWDMGAADGQKDDR